MTSRTTHCPSTLAVLLACVCMAGCPTTREEPGAQRPSEEIEAPEPVDTPLPTAQQEQDERGEAAHHVVFADRTSQAYLLMLTGTPTQAPTREELSALVHEKLASAQDEPEVALLLDLIAAEPAPAVGQPGLSPERSQEIRHRDLLGLHIDLLPLAPQGEEALIPLAVLKDPISTRTLTPPQRESLQKRRYVLVLRAHYRNRFGVRGLRLLQTLVRVVATDRDALIHDPDTGETMGVDAFTARRLRSTVGNVAEQVVVVPFPDPRHEGAIRLSTRGMRRFGSVDLELDGLPRDPAVLDAATHLLHGLAYRMVRDGEYDREGYAVEVDDVITVDFDTVRRAYGGRGDVVKACASCPKKTQVHLVERPPQSHDPAEHVVARVVAPRLKSDQPNYDQRAWAMQAVVDVMGPPPSAVQ